MAHDGMIEGLTEWQGLTFLVPPQYAQITHAESG
jgi:hypothetical protein